MGFNSVYQTLKELFPQVDARILKAVAIEHSKDPDGAVESILTDVLPFINMHSHIPTSDVKSNGKAVELCSQNFSMLGSAAGYSSTACGQLDTGDCMNSLRSSKSLDDSLASSFYDAKDSYDNPSGNSRSDELMASASFVGTSAEGGPGTSDSLAADSDRDVCNGVFESNVNEDCIPLQQYQDRGIDLNANKNSFALSSSAKGAEADVKISNGCNVHPDPEFLNGRPSHDRNAASTFDCQKEQSSLDCNSLENEDVTEETLVPVKNHMLDALDLNIPEPENGMLFGHDEHQEASGYIDTECVPESSIGDPVATEDETVLSTVVTRSGHMCRIDLLEDLIENAKSHKDSLLTVMETVMGLIKEVEFQEKAAQQAKEDVGKGGLKILDKVEELKKMLKHAKEANDMRAGEVYGEQSILATEVKELQTRLLGLSDEKDKSISILDEMRKTLEARLVVAEEERRKAEQEISEKEVSARSALAEQELIMEKVVQESKLSQQEAEENAKLRDFLMEKGRVVDMLQGEISVICQDVTSLKENFDNRVSLCKSPLVRQTSSLLGSSNSSVKSAASDPGPAQLRLFGSPTKTSRTPSVGSQTPQSSVGEEQAIKAGGTPRKDLLDEDWQLFDF